MQPQGYVHTRAEKVCGFSLSNVPVLKSVQAMAKFEKERCPNHQKMIRAPLFVAS